MSEANRKGYKKTKLGWIPEDWKVSSFWEISKRRKSKLNPNNNPSYKCIELEHLESDTGRIIGLVESESQKSNKNVFKENDILFGKLRPYLKKYWHATFNGVCSSEIWVLRNQRGVSPKYLYYLIQTNRFISATNVSTGTKMPRADWNFLSGVLFPLPSLLEQKKIAEILATWDRAIETLEQLIAQKEELKRGLMQQLLSGKTRFPGFEGEWEEIEFGKLGSSFSGLSGKSKEDFGQGAAFIPYMNIFENSVIDIENLNYVTIEEDEKQNAVEYGDIFFTVSSETPDEVGMTSVLLDHLEEAYLNSFCFGFRLKSFKKILPEFAARYLRSSLFRKEIYKLAQGSTRFNLTKRFVMSISIHLPPIEEQKRIARLFTDLDFEIKSLTESKNNLIKQKKGLMQQLLTGKTRVK